MPTLLDEPETPTLIKLILFGFTGKGKTTAIIPLSIPEIVPGFPGLKLHIYDYDGKFAEIARNQLKLRANRTLANKNRLTPISAEQHSAALANIEVVRLREHTKMTRDGKRDIVGAPRMWEKTAALYEKWSKDAGPGHIFVIDSWTHMCGAPLLGWAMALDGEPLSAFGDAPHGRDYKTPQKVSKDFMALLADAKAHCIITAHQSPTDMRMKTGEYDENQNAIEEVVHSEMSMISVGTAGRIQLPSEFNHTLVATSDVSGDRRISTQIEDGVTTKTPFFGLADKSYSLDDGLARYWMLASSPTLTKDESGKS